MPKTDPMTEMTNEFLVATLSGQALGLNLLLAEMRALGDVLPGVSMQMPVQPQHVSADEEADFDNMPV